MSFSFFYLLIIYFNMLQQTIFLNGHY